MAILILSFMGLEIPAYAVSLLLVVFFYFLGQIALLVIKKASFIASKTKTSIDDHMLSSIKKPLKIFFILIGFYAGLYYYNPEISIGPLTLSKIFTVIWVFVGAYFVSQIVKALFHWYSNELSRRTNSDFDDNLFPFLKKIINIAIYLIAFLVVFDKLGIQIGPMLAGLGIAGLAVALALQDTLSNFFAAVYIAIDKPVKIGDYIELDGGIKGYVDDLGWRSTRIRKLGNNIVVVPNSKLSQAILTNYNSPKPEMSLSIPVSVSYSNDLDKVESVTLEVANDILQHTDGGIKDFKPLVRYKEFGSSINLSVILRVRKYADQFLVQHEFIKQLHKRYKKEHIELPAPQPQRDIRTK